MTTDFEDIPNADCRRLTEPIVRYEHWANQERSSRVHFSFFLPFSYLPFIPHLQRSFLCVFLLLLPIYFSSSLCSSLFHSQSTTIHSSFHTSCLNSHEASSPSTYFIEPHFPYAYRNLLPSGLGLVFVSSIPLCFAVVGMITTLLDYPRVLYRVLLHRILDRPSHFPTGYTSRAWTPTL
jgi:hypothetical protein